jgi:type I restriction enzyme M protein
MPKAIANNKDTTANLGLEAKLWAAADALRNNMDAAEYKHVVLGLIFLKSISDAFEAKHAELEAQKAQGADPEDPDEYLAASIFWVPKEARWQHLKASAPQPTIGTLVDDAMAAIERDNPSLKGVLPKDYARPGLDKQRLGQIINLVGDIALGSVHERHPDFKADDVLANPPFNDSDWRGELLKNNKRWVYGAPPAGNANYARVNACN